MMMSPNPQPTVVGHSIHLCLHPLHRCLQRASRKLLAPLNAIMQSLAAIDEHQAEQSQHQQSQESSYFDFLATQPLEFTKTIYLLQANHWFRVTESKFGLLHCSKYQKTLFTAQQLRGSASAWCATYTSSIQDNHQVSWKEFCTTFCERHISTRIMHRNLREFQDLQQGTHSVYEYIKNFNYLGTIWNSSC
jgi:hypothetical protein